MGHRPFPQGPPRLRFWYPQPVRSSMRPWPASTELLAVTLTVLRMHLGWVCIGSRLLSAIVEYEETGWYDRQVKPVLSRVKLTLVGLAVSLFVCALIFVNIEYPVSAPLVPKIGIRQFNDFYQFVFGSL